MMKNKYFIKRNGQYYTDFTKEEIYGKIDNYNPNTFVPFLKILDYPFLKEEWFNTVKKAKNNKVFGKYCALMRLRSYRDFTFKDSELLNNIREEKAMKNDLLIYWTAKKEYISKISGKIDFDLDNDYLSEDENCTYTFFSLDECYKAISLLCPLATFSIKFDSSYKSAYICDFDDHLWEFTKINI